MSSFDKTDFIPATTLQGAGSLNYIFLESKDVVDKFKDNSNFITLNSKFSNIKFELSPKVTKSAQTVSALVGIYEKQLFNFIPSINETRAPLLKLSFLNLDNSEISEIGASFPGEEPITNITFFNVPLAEDTKKNLTCAFFDENSQTFKLRTESNCTTSFS
jgi:hypothetical protein